MTSNENPGETSLINVNSMWTRDAASQAMGMKITSLGAGHAIVEMTVRDDMLNGHGTCHGSFIFALADSAFALACNSHGPTAVAAHCDISFLSPVTSGEMLRAGATEIFHKGRSGIYDVTVKREDGSLVAVFRGKSRTIAARASKDRETSE